MVVIPAGSFMMGSEEKSEERPRHRVMISRAFAVGKYEVTFAEWHACVRAGSCSHRPDDEGWGRSNRPVMMVNWGDAKTYVRWLNRKTGHEYRLPSESEWEYAARAGTKTAYHFGGRIDSSQANYSSNPGKTVPVGRYAANAFGLHDVHGNVWEWVEDCWNGGYAGAPSDGQAWTSGDCSIRVLRGGSYAYISGGIRSALRGRGATGNRFRGLGFRVARTLP